MGKLRPVGVRGVSTSRGAVKRYINKIGLKSPNSSTLFKAKPKPLISLSPYKK